MSQDSGHAGEPTSMQQQQPRHPVIAQGYPAQHMAPGYEHHLFCQCGCGAPLGAAGAVHAAAQHEHQHQCPPEGAGAHSHAPFRGVLRGTPGMVQPPAHPPTHMYGTAPPSYRAQQDMQQIQSHFAAAAAMTHYANYGRGLSDFDQYRNAHMAACRPPVEIPRGYVVPPPGAPAYLPAGSHHLQYYRRYMGEFPYGGGRDSRTERAGVQEAPIAANTSGSAATAPQKESILESLLAARSDRAAAAAAAAAVAASRQPPAPAHGENDATAPPTGENVEPTCKAPVGVSTKRVDEDEKDGGTKSTETLKVEKSRKSREQLQLVTSPPPARQKPAEGGGATVAVAGGGLGAVVPAVPAMRLTGVHRGFPGDVHAMSGIGGVPPTLQGVPPTSLGIPYVPAALAPQPPSLPPSQAAAAMGTYPVGFASHDAYEEHLRQQEKKLQKRAANRKSAQLSRKRKKALIEELRYENEDLQRHEDILAVIPDPVFAFDAADGRVWFASNSASVQFGLPVEDLTSACFFDLMSEDCSKRLRVLVDAALKDVSETNSALLHERMTVRFKKRKGAIHLGELSGRLSKQADGITAVCSVRPLSMGNEEFVGKGYIGDASMSELAEDTSADQGSSGEDSRSAGTGQTGSNADCSSGLGTGCTSIADEASSSGVPSLSSLQVKRVGSIGGGGSTSSSGSVTGSADRNSGNGGGSGGPVGIRGVGTDARGSSTSSGGGSTGSGGVGEGSTGSGGSEEGGPYNSISDYGPSFSGGQEGDEETPHTDSDGGGRKKKKRARVVVPRSTNPAADASVGCGGGGVERNAAVSPQSGSDRRGGDSSINRNKSREDGGEMAGKDGGEVGKAAVEVRQWEVAAGIKGGHGEAADKNYSASKRRHNNRLGQNHVN